MPGAGAGASGAEDDEPSVEDDDEPSVDEDGGLCVDDESLVLLELLEELLGLSVWAHAAAPLPTIKPANAAAAMACLSCTGFRSPPLRCRVATVTDEPGIAL